MKIGIDARLINETGVGRYIRNLVDELRSLDHENTYIVFLKKDSFDTFKIPNERWQKRLADVPWHSIQEQFVMPWLLVREHLDLVHIPYFNVPIFYPGKFAVTIHDLTILHFDTGKASTLPYVLYKLRRLGYYLTLAVGLVRATKILAVSQATKQEIIDHFGIPPKKITVTYEGVDEELQNPKLITRNSKPLVKDPYFLYVGNAYPHKNLEMLLGSFKNVISQGDNKKVTLVLVGKDDFFYQWLRLTVSHLQLSDSVLFYGPATDEQLANLYKHAEALVFPSLMEGFGLPGLEALCFGCALICSDITSFREVYKDIPVYVDPLNGKQLTQALCAMLDNPPSEEWKKKAQHFVRQYSWDMMAKETLSVYLQS